MGLSSQKYIICLFVVTLSLHQLMDENAIRWLSQFSQFGLSSEEVRTLVYAKNTGDVSNEYCRSLTGYDTAKSSNLLARLRGLGILHQHSHGYATYYTISEKYSGSKAENVLFTQMSTQDTQRGTNNASSVSPANNPRGDFESRAENEFGKT